MGTLRQAWADYRDESFVLQFLSPKLIRDFRLFAVSDDAKDAAMRGEVHPQRAGLQATCAAGSSRHYDVAAQDPDLQVTDADLSGSRRLVLTHRVRNGVLLDKTEAERTLQYLAQLWGYRVKLVEQDDRRRPRAQGARGAADALSGAGHTEAIANPRQGEPS